MSIIQEIIAVAPLIEICLKDIITTEPLIESATDILHKELSLLVSDIQDLVFKLQKQIPQKQGYQKPFVPQEDLEDMRYGRGKYEHKPMNKIVFTKDFMNANGHTAATGCSGNTGYSGATGSTGC